ncbi:MAG TPA: hypothetical protein VGL66_16050 [Caulobacteraceae bacterium]
MIVELSEGAGFNVALVSAGAAVGASLLTAVATFGVAIGREAYLAHRQRRCIASVLAAEMEMIILRVDDDQTEQAYENIRTMLISGSLQRIPDLAAREIDRPRLYDSFVKDLGLLPTECAREIAKFYSDQAFIRNVVRFLSGRNFADDIECGTAVGLIDSGIKRWRRCRSIVEVQVPILKRIAGPK